MSLPNPHSYPASPVDGLHLESAPALDGAFDRQEQAPGLWSHRLSASFSAMADQIAAVSQALALIPPTAFSGTDVGAEVGALRARLDGIERTQGRLAAEVEALKTQLATRGDDVRVVVTAAEAAPVPDAAAQAAKIEALEKRLDELSETVRRDQERLPARLHNAGATMKATLRTPVAGFPMTRGEFEHTTKERYEADGGLSLNGDTAAKREALRAFAGVRRDGQYIVE